jgi:hypothetical protein
MRKCEQALQRALQAIAQPPEIQMELFPTFVVVADELALDFDQALQYARYKVGSQWTEAQIKALESLDRELEANSGPDKPEIWETPDCLSHPSWSAFRELASAALSAFDWSNQIPKPSGAIYVGPART